MKRIELKLNAIALMAVALMFTAILAGCSGNAAFNASREITLISREEGSGTRGAFVSLFGVEYTDENGVKVDGTSEEAINTNNTSVVMTSVSLNKYAIGYVSLGSLNKEAVKPVNIDGVEPTAENVKNGSYKIARPFNIATRAALSDLAQDFIGFMISAVGQKVIADAGYIPVSDAPAYSGARPSGKLVIAGSSSVAPVMDKLREAYLALNQRAEIELQQSDSSVGMSSTVQGICDIGMASRELKQSELDAGLTSTVIALDGIVVVVNNANPVSALTKEQVAAMFTGKVLRWDEIL
jgi:phosphate transport system substrate-binding protein